MIWGASSGSKSSGKPGTSLAEGRSHLTLESDEALSGQTESLPPKQIVLDGVPRSLSREITPSEAVRLAARGLPAIVLSFGFGTRVTADELNEVLRSHLSDFQAGGPHSREAYTHVYGRRSAKAHGDTRIVVASILHLRREES